MLQFKLNDTAAELILTLTENVSISNPYYLAVFTHVLTGDVVAFILNSAADESLFINRYNKYTINPTVLFSGKQPGEWHYKFYEQASAVNTDVTMAGNILEIGKMMLDRATDFAYQMYNSATTYKTYNG